MDVLKDAWSLLRRLAGSHDSPGRTGPSESESAAEGPAPTTEAEAPDEFEDFLAGIGADVVPGDAPEMAIAQSTIAELKTNLQNLQPLGEELARTERARLASEERLQELERQAARYAAEAAEIEARATELESLRHELAEARAALAESKAREKELERSARDADNRAKRMERSLEAARRKRDERHRVAAERWKQLQELRAELKQARKM